MNSIRVKKPGLKKVGGKRGPSAGKTKPGTVAKPPSMEAMLRKALKG